MVSFGNAYIARFSEREDAHEHNAQKEKPEPEPEAPAECSGELEERNDYDDHVDEGDEKEQKIPTVAPGHFEVHIIVVDRN